MSTELIVNPEVREPAGGTLIEVAASRQALEVQAMILLAKRFPRDEDVAIARVQTACKRKKLAEVSMYQYSRGGTDITGPSIRLAECLAQCWGNIEHGIKELSQQHGESVVESYCWDMETNYRASKVFTVKHVRTTKDGSYALSDPRDIYEHVANVGARRVRACILSVIPKDVQDLAVEQCTKTLLEGHTEPLVDRVRKMLAAFSELGVTKPMIEAKCQRKIESLTEHSLLSLRKIYTSIKDGMSVAEDHFDFAVGAPVTDPGESKAARATKQLESKRSKKGAAAAPAPEAVEAAEPPADAPSIEESAVPPSSPSPPAEFPSAETKAHPLYAAYRSALIASKTEADCRAAWVKHCLEQASEELPKPIYHEFCQMRDQMIAHVNKFLNTSAAAS